MKKRIIGMLMLLAFANAITACGKKNDYADLIEDSTIEELPNAEKYNTEDSYDDLYETTTESPEEQVSDPISVEGYDGVWSSAVKDDVNARNYMAFINSDIITIVDYTYSPINGTVFWRGSFDNSADASGDISIVSDKRIGSAKTEPNFKGSELNIKCENGILTFDGYDINSNGCEVKLKQITSKMGDNVFCCLGENQKDYSAIEDLDARIEYSDKGSSFLYMKNNGTKSSGLYNVSCAYFMKDGTFVDFKNNIDSDHSDSIVTRIAPGKDYCQKNIANFEFDYCMVILDPTMESIATEEDWAENLSVEASDSNGNIQVKITNSGDKEATYLNVTVICRKDGEIVEPDWDSLMEPNLILEDKDFAFQSANREYYNHLIEELEPGADYIFEFNPNVQYDSYEVYLSTNVISDGSMSSAMYDGEE